MYLRNAKWWPAIAGSLWTPLRPSRLSALSRRVHNGHSSLAHSVRRLRSRYSYHPTAVASIVHRSVPVGTAYALGDCPSTGERPGGSRDAPLGSVLACLGQACLARRAGARARAHPAFLQIRISLLQVIRISLLQIRISLLQARISLLQARLSTNLAPRDSISLSARLPINGMGSPATLRLRPQAPDSSSVLELQTRAPSSSSRLHLPPRAPAVLSALKLQPQPSRVGARRRALPTAW